MNFKYSVWPSNPVSNRGEFLTDVGWFYGGGNKKEYGIVLVAESELSPGGWKRIDHDFDKLLHIKAARKLFVFRSQTGKDHERGHKSICEFLKSYRPHLVGEEFIFVEFGCLRPPHLFAYKFVVGEAPGGFSPLAVGLTKYIRTEGVCSVANQFHNH